MAYEGLLPAIAGPQGESRVRDTVKQDLVLESQG